MFAATAVVVSSAIFAAAPASAADTSPTFAIRYSPSAGGANVTLTYGPAAALTPIAGDWDNNGAAEIGTSRVSGTTRSWSLANGIASGGAGQRFGFIWGSASTGCTPISGKWTTGSVTTVGLACPDGPSHAWRWTFNPTNGPGGAIGNFLFGSIGCRPIVGDWNGNGTTNVGVACQDGASTSWYLNTTDRSSSGTWPTSVGASDQFSWGNPSPKCRPVIGNWDNTAATRDGRAVDADTVGIVCPDGNTLRWQLSNTNRAAGAGSVFNYGAASGVALTGRWTAGNATGIAAVTGISTPATSTDITYEDLVNMFGDPVGNETRVRQGLPSLNQQMAAANINTPARQAAFLATLYNESNLQFDAEEFSNSSPWRGRGFIQLTTEYNYASAKRDLGGDFTGDSSLAKSLQWSAKIAVWYWNVARDINPYADDFDMGKVSGAIGYPDSAAKDYARCDDFRAAYRVLSGGDEVPSYTNCRR